MRISLGWSRRPGEQGKAGGAGEPGAPRGLAVQAHYERGRVSASCSSEASGALLQ